MPIIMPVPFGYEIANQMVCAGPVSRAACDEAIKIARANAGSVIFFCAQASKDKRFRNVPLGIACRRYTQHAAPDTATVFQKAPGFNTFSEAVALAKYVRSCDATQRQHIIVVVKSWHARRTHWIVLRVFEKYGLHNVITFHTYQHQPTGRQILREKIAVVINAWRLYKLKPD